MIDYAYERERQERIQDAESHMFEDLEAGKEVREEDLRYPQLVLSLRAWKLRRESMRAQNERNKE